MPDHRPSLPLPVLLSLLMLTQTFGWGVNVSLLGVLAAPAGADLGLSPTMVYGGATALFLCAAATGPAAGRAVDRFGGPRVLAFGSVVPALALALMALAQGPVLWFCAWALQGVATHVALATAAYGALAQQAGGQARRAIGTLTLATGLCATVMWPVSGFLMEAVGWRGMCLAYAGATLAIVLPIHLWISLRAGQRATPEAASAAASTPLAGSAGVFRLVAVFQTVSVVVGTSLMVLLIDIFTALGTPRPEAIFAASLVGVAYLVSRALLVAIGERLPPVTLAAAVLVAMPLSLAPLVLWPLSGAPLPAWVAAATAVAYGLPAGLLGILRPTIPQQVFGAASYGRALGRLARPGDLANAAAPAVFAALLAVSASAAVLAAVALCLVGLVAIRRLMAAVAAQSPA
jgi:MFS family permease